MKFVPITVLCAGLFVGCHRPPAVSATQPSPPPVTQPTTAPSAYLTIDRQVYLFPHALIRFSKQTDGQVRGRLTTDDPAEAIDENYHGNSFDLELIEESGAWKLRSPAIAQAEDKLHGIFLDGQRRRLHARDVAVQVEQAGSEASVSLDGWFTLAETVQTEPVPPPAPKTVHVRGRVVASVVEQ